MSVVKIIELKKFSLSFHRRHQSLNVTIMFANFWPNFYQSFCDFNIKEDGRAWERPTPFQIFLISLDEKFC